MAEGKWDISGLSEVDAQVYRSFMDWITKDDILKKELSFSSLLKKEKRNGLSVKSFADLENKIKVAQRDVTEKRKELEQNIRQMELSLNFFSSANAYKQKVKEIVARDTKGIFGASFLEKDLENYEEAKKEQINYLKIMYNIIDSFQSLLREKLNIEIIYLFTTNKQIKKAQRKRGAIPLDQLLNFSSIRTTTAIGTGESVSFKENQMTELKIKADKELQNFQGIAALVIKAVKQLRNEQEVIKKEDILMAIQNEEQAYEEISRRWKIYRARQCSWVLWTAQGYWQKQAIYTRGPIEEARQRFLLQIHQKDIYQLFENDTEKINGVIQQESKVDESKYPTSENYIHNFIRSKQGIAGVDNRPGLILDDTTIAIKDLLPDLKKALGINRKEGYLSVGSKTKDANFLGYQNFFNLIKKIDKFQNSKKKDREEGLAKWVKKIFFEDGGAQSFSLDVMTADLAKTALEGIIPMKDNK